MPTNYNPDTDAIETMQERFEREAEVDERIMRGEREKAAKTEHTPEPWEWSKHKFNSPPFEGTLEQECGIYPPLGESGPVAIASGEANARRIVACVNACAGLSTGFLEQIDSIQSALTGQLVVTEVLENQRDELLAAIDTVVKAIMIFRNEPTLQRLHALRSSNGYGVLQQAMDIGLDVIASVKADHFRGVTKMIDEASETSIPAIVFYPAGSLGEPVDSEGDEA